MTSPNFPHYLKLEFLSDNNKLNSVDRKSCDYRSNAILPFAESPVYYSKIVSATCLTKGDDVKIVYDVALDIQNVEFPFQPGNTIGIFPCNDKNEVKQLFHRLNLTSVCNQMYRLSVSPQKCSKKCTIPPHIPAFGTLYELFLKRINIRSFPKKSFLKFLMKYTTKEDEINKLQSLCLPISFENYQEFALANGTLLKLLTTISSCEPPIEGLLEYLPPLLPRPYSIASSPLIKMDLHIIFDVHYHNGTKGVCSGWLENIITNSQENTAKDISNITTKFNQLDIYIKNEVHIPFYFRKCNRFTLPLDPMIPIIMIGSGTGIAPFIGFLEHRHLETTTNNKFGTSWLIYGCRYANKDFLHKLKIEEYYRNGTLTKLFSCYSRENETKTYVQDIIKTEIKNIINNIVNESAIVYVCGNATHMVKGVKNMIISCLVEDERMSTAEAKLFIKHLEHINRYIEDFWL